MEQQPNMSPVIPHSPQALNDLGHPRGGPEVGEVPKMSRPFQQQSWQPGQPMGRQLGWTPRSSGRLQPAPPLLLVSLHPAQHAHMADLVLPGDLGRLHSSPPVGDGRALTLLHGQEISPGPWQGSHSVWENRQLQSRLT